MSRSPGQQATSIADAAEAIADMSKCVSVVGGVLQIVAITARCMHMVSEASRGRRYLPSLHSELIELLSCACECAMVVVDAESGMEKFRLNHVFSIQEQCIETLGSIEEQLMRRWMNQAWNANLMSDTESKVIRLREGIVTALNSRDIADLRRIVNEMTSYGTKTVMEDIVPIPTLSRFFFGRKEERRKLLDILERHGSAGISQHGGAGKTELMEYFAEYARGQRLVFG